MTFIPLREPTSVHWKELEGRFTDSSYRWLSIREWRFPAFVISSESEKSFSFAAKKGCERSGQWETPCSLRPEKRCFMQTAPYSKRNTANEKDPSAPLGMTIRECRFARIRHFERKREIFFVRGKTKAVRGTASGKHPAPCAPQKRCFMQAVSCRKMKEKSISNRR